MSERNSWETMLLESAFVDAGKGTQQLSLTAAERLEWVVSAEQRMYITSIIKANDASERQDLFDSALNRTSFGVQQKSAYLAAPWVVSQDADEQIALLAVYKTSLRNDSMTSSKDHAFEDLWLPSHINQLSESIEAAIGNVTDTSVISNRVIEHSVSLTQAALAMDPETRRVWGEKEPALVYLASHALNQAGGTDERLAVFTQEIEVDSEFVRRGVYLGGLLCAADQTERAGLVTAALTATHRPAGYGDLDERWSIINSYFNYRKDITAGRLEA